MSDVQQVDYFAAARAGQGRPDARDPQSYQMSASAVTALAARLLAANATRGLDPELFHFPLASFDGGRLKVYKDAGELARDPPAWAGPAPARALDRLLVPQVARTHAMLYGQSDLVGDDGGVRAEDFYLQAFLTTDGWRLAVVSWTTHPSPERPELPPDDAAALRTLMGAWMDSFTASDNAWFQSLRRFPHVSTPDARLHVLEGPDVLDFEGFRRLADSGMGGYARTVVKDLEILGVSADKAHCLTDISRQRADGREISVERCQYVCTKGLDGWKVQQSALTTYWDHSNDSSTEDQP